MAARWAEWTVARDLKQVTLQVIVDASTRAPVIMDLGPVRAIENVLGSKLIATVPLTELTGGGRGISRWRRCPVA